MKWLVVAYLAVLVGLWVHTGVNPAVVCHALGFPGPATGPAPKPSAS